jgi:hypothetical protein
VRLAVPLSASLFWQFPNVTAVATDLLRRVGLANGTAVAAAQDVESIEVASIDSATQAIAYLSDADVAARLREKIMDASLRSET